MFGNYPWVASDSLPLPADHFQAQEMILSATQLLENL